MALPRFRGDRLLAAREAAGLSREDLTLALDLSSPYRILQWESGNERPQPRFIPPLADVLGVEAMYLLDVDPEDPPLAALRLAAGVATEQMGAPGMSIMTYQRLEVGRLSVTPTPAIVAAIAAALNVEPARVEAAILRSRGEPDPPASPR
ncbi:MAG: helix-turn-helix domain-containing protein [Mycobacteriales bacterium]